MSYRMPTQNCPACGTRLDAASGLCEDTPRPKAGDFTVCIDCAALMTFTKSLTVALVDPGGMKKIHPDDLADIRRAQAAIRRAKEEYGR